MTDYFALLGVPRRPWIELDSLKARFFSLSAEVHPDKVHEAPEPEKRAAHERYTELNAAYNTLREPKERLRHLLELERSQKPKQVQEVPSAALELFGQVAKACREADSFLAERLKVSSPLLKVRMFECSQEWIEKLKALQQQIILRRDELFEELKQLNAAWEKIPHRATGQQSVPLPLDRMEDLYRALSFITRWMGQIQERLVNLAE